MSHEELLAKAVEYARKAERTFERHPEKIPAEILRLKVDEMSKTTIRDAVAICFEADDQRGSIEFVMDSHSGDIIDSKYIPPKKKRDDDGGGRPTL